MKLTLIRLSVIAFIFAVFGVFLSPIRAQNQSSASSTGQNGCCGSPTSSQISCPGGYIPQANSDGSANCVQESSSNTSH